MATTPEPTTTAPDPRRWAILGVLCLSVFLVVVDNTIVNVALPTFARELEASTSQLQWIVDAYSLVFAGLLLAAGSLGDRRGRKGTLQVGLVLFALTSLAASLASTATQLIAARAAMGIGAALVFPATLAILTNVFTDPVERAKAIGAWSGVTGLAVALGPISGGFLLEHFSWGSIFLVNLPIVATALVLGRRLVPTSRDEAAGRWDLVGIAASIATITLLVWTVIEAPKAGWGSAQTIGGFVVVAALLAAFVRHEARVEHPMLDVTVFRNARFSAASLAVATAFFGLFGFIFLVTQYFQVVRGYDTLSAGVHTLPFAITAAIISPVSARLALRFGTKRIVGLGLASMSVGFFWASFLTADTSYWAVIVPQMIFMAGGLALTTAPATESIMGSLPKAKAGVGSAVNDTTREIGGTLGVAVVGSAFSSLYGPQIVDKLTALGVPAEPVRIAEESVVAAVEVANRAPAFARPAILEAASDAFLHGMALGCRVAALATLVGSAVAFAALPARASAPAGEVDDGPLGVDALAPA
ncbi:MAG: DHA2 family efflux MFS transporter permease subunit [Acidimicrobiales bacterium]|nr:DHA2 family efflux MFS transporter permease subunit [Acidimicrobiales bacterium]HRW37352.1 DHA2 family efflux MFS transporter permease subunit [Aquihabitans sp.]